MITPNANQIGTLVVSYINECEGELAPACLKDFAEALDRAPDEAEKRRIANAWLSIYTRSDSNIAPRGLY